MKTIYPFTRIWLFPLVRFFMRKTNGLENVPLKGPFIIASKHMGTLDFAFVVATIIPVIKKKIHFISNIAKWGWVWKKIIAEKWGGCIPFTRENPQICLDVAVEYLKKGRVIGIFPEGVMQDYDPKKHRAKTGVSRLAIWAKVPILPIGLTHDISVRSDLPFLVRRRQVIKNILLNPHSLELNIGRPFELSEYYNRELTNDLLHEATAKVMKRIYSLTHINYTYSDK